jgi:hypothetical protein
MVFPQNVSQQIFSGGAKIHAMPTSNHYVPMHEMHAIAKTIFLIFFYIFSNPCG